MNGGGRGGGGGGQHCRRGAWRAGHGRLVFVHGGVVLERELEKKLLRLLVPESPEFVFGLVDFSRRDFERDGLVRLGGEQQVLPLAIWKKYK